MNQFTIAVLVLVVFCYCGGKYCPAVLKQNKEILLGVVGGLVLASFFGLKLEAMGPPRGRAGFGEACDDNTKCTGTLVCNNGVCGSSRRGSVGDMSQCEGTKLTMCQGMREALRGLVPSEEGEPPGEYEMVL